MLDMAETELVVLPAILCQNLKGPMMWQQRGCLRVGISRVEIRDVQKFSDVIASFGGTVLP